MIDVIDLDKTIETYESSEFALSGVPESAILLFIVVSLIPVILIWKFGGIRKGLEALCIVPLIFGTFMLLFTSPIGVALFIYLWIRAWKLRSNPIVLRGE